MEKMNRRTVIRNVLFISAGAMLIPSCTHDAGKASIDLKNLTVTGDQEALLKTLTETIIPKTSSPGANDLSSHLFVLMMVDDCQSKENQQKYLKGMDEFEVWSAKRFGGGFASITPEQKAALLNDLEAKKDAPENALAFYGLTKRLTLQHYTSSEYFLTKIQGYQMVPGRWHGCVPVKATT